jgi:hypothetical protein
LATGFVSCGSVTAVLEAVCCSSAAVVGAVPSVTADGSFVGTSVICGAVTSGIATSTSVGCSWALQPTSSMAISTAIIVFRVFFIVILPFFLFCKPQYTHNHLKV